METKKLSIKTASYPLPEDAPKRLKLFIILTPMFFMLAISLPSFIRQQLTPVICEEANSTAYYSLIMLISTMSGSIFSPIVGKLGDLYGRKRLSLFCLVPFAGSLILCGLARGPVLLAISYALIGIFYSGLDSATNGMVMDAFNRKDSTQILGVLNAANTIAGILGPILIGYLADLIGAQKSMIILAAVVMAAWVLILVGYPDIRNIKRDVVIDYKGVILLPVAIGPICVAIAVGGNQLPWNSPWIIAMFVVSVICCVLFVWTEKKQKQPIVNIGLLKNKMIIPALLFMFAWRAMQSLLTYFNLYCREVLEFSSTQLGSLQFFLWVNVIVAVLVGRYLSRKKNYRLIFSISAILSVLAPLLFFLFMRPGLPFFWAVVLRIPQIIMVGFCMAPMNMYLGEILKAEERGMGLAINMFFINLGTSVFNAIFSAVMNLFPGGIADAFGPMCLVAVGIGVIRLLVVLVGIKNRVQANS